MALILHILVALGFGYLYQGPLRRVADFLLGRPRPASEVTLVYIQSLAWTGMYLRGLLFIVVVPAVTAELLSLLFPAALLGGRGYIFFPHFLLLALDSRFLPLIRRAFLEVTGRNS